MREQIPQLNVDEAMAEFQVLARDLLGNSLARGPAAAPTPEEAEANRFHFAESILSLACPDPTACTNEHCRRQRICRHFARVHAKRASGQSAHPRRTPGAEACRYAIWVFMNSGR
jgi:hypothetical protein